MLMGAVHVDQDSLRHCGELYFDLCGYLRDRGDSEKQISEGCNWTDERGIFCDVGCLCGDIAPDFSMCPLILVS